MLAEKSCKIAAKFSGLAQILFWLSLTAQAEEAVPLKQAYVREPDITVEQLDARVAKETGADAKVTGFVRFALGAGVDKNTGDFAAEVAALTGAS